MRPTAAECHAVTEWVNASERADDDPERYARSVTALTMLGIEAPMAWTLADHLFQCGAMTRGAAVV